MVLLLRAYTKIVKPPIIPVAVQTSCDTLRFFTDGGAMNPTCTDARIASWSVAQDIADSDHQRKDAANFPRMGLSFLAFV